MILGIKPTVDVVFKAVFGSADSIAITTDFINSFLEAAGKQKAIALTIQNPFRLGRFYGEKDAVLDISARDELEREFQLEIQVRPYADLPRRMLHNWAACYLSRLRKGEDYKALRPVISIWILEHELFRDGRWLHSFGIRDPGTETSLCEDLSIMIIELPVWRREHARERGRFSIEREADRWLYFLVEGDQLDPEATPETLAGTMVEEAVKTMAGFTRSEAARDLYRRRLEFSMEQASIKAEARQAGLAEGRAEGRVQGRVEGRIEGQAEGKNEATRAFAVKLKARGYAVSEIAELTGLAESEIAALT
jgi:conserved hypothetical protein (putative transposase or invertase)